MASNGLSISFTRKDLGLKRITKDMEALGEYYAAIGFPKGEVVSAGKSKGSGHKPAATMGELATIAAVHEFGSESKGIKPRPFMAQTQEKAMRRLKWLDGHLYDKVVKGLLTPKQALDKIGVYYEGKMKDTIRNGSFAANAPATIKLKGSSRPLIDTGQMRNSVVSVTRKV